MTDIDLAEIIPQRAVNLVPTGQHHAVPQREFGHVHVRGTTESFQTSLSLATLAVQFIEAVSASEPDRVIVLDLAGDPDLFWTTARARDRSAG